MNRLLVSLAVVFLLSGCGAFPPVTAEDVRAEAGLYSDRSDVGGYYRYDRGGVEIIPPWSR